MSSVITRGIAKRYDEIVALNPLDLEIGDGEFLTLLGPSGCGKTTTLRLIAGFIRPSEGRILFGGEDVTTLPPQHRAIGMVFQDYALFPHMTIAENIGFGLAERRCAAAEIATRVGDLLQLIKLPGVEKRYPAELSGGQQQRVAVARAVAHSPRVLLMDEPLGALDLKLRETMQTEIRRIQQKLKITTVYVTHDQTEAMSMSDRIAVMNGGTLEQIGTAHEIYNTPRSRFVADFVGQINLLTAVAVGREAGWTIAAIGERHVRADTPFAPEAGEFAIGIRPEQLAILTGAAPPSRDVNALAGTVVARHFAGNMVKILVDIGAPSPMIVDGHPNDDAANPGDAVTIVWDPRHAVVLRH